VARISKALKGSADAIQGINTKFDIAETQYRKLHSFQGKLNNQVEGSLDACTKLEATLHSRAEGAVLQFEDAAEGFTLVLENMVDVLQGLNIQREVSALPKAMVPLMIPLVILLIELAVANAYLGILIASLPEVRDKYSWCSSYLLGNASCVLFGLTISLVWLAGYRIYLSCKSRNFKIMQGSSGEETIGDDRWRPTAEEEEEEYREEERQERNRSHFGDAFDLPPSFANPARPALKRSMSMPVLEARFSKGRSEGSSGELFSERIPGSSGELERRAEQRAMLHRQMKKESAELHRSRATRATDSPNCVERASERRRRNTRSNRDPSIRREQLRRRFEQSDSR
jgi:hypothetical protein